ncbi:hypothetical protein QUF76_09335 [Desulfobacterales bacterium HSG16]|nr:hypothetical protein [Desulfobacterales bacterium HSG16]
MTLKERWIDKGRLKGMNEWYEKCLLETGRLIQLEAIQMGLSFRFEDQYQNLMDIIDKIEDVEKLKQIKKAIKKVNDEYEFRQVIEQ